MTNTQRTVRAGAVATLLGLSLSGCADFLTVKNPNLINASAIDPIADAPTLAASAQQNFAQAYGSFAMYQSWFTGEALVAETFPTRNEFGRREVLEANGSHNGDLWGPLSVSLSSNAQVLDLELPEAGSNINLARAAAFKGYSFVLMAESFCFGVAQESRALTTAEMLDSAIASFNTAISVGTANASATGVSLANLARVGLARAQLQAGNGAAAAAAAQSVPDGFEFNLNYVDDLANRTRLGNRLWQFTLDRGSISVAPAFQVDDPRVPFLPPSEHSLSPQDAGTGDFYIQQKYPGFDSPMRLGSKLEADYIAAEVNGTAAQLTLIAARRAANDQPVYSGPTDAAAVLTELMEQKGRDFYLEAKRMGDFRRVPAAVLNVPVPGTEYFKPGFAPVGNQVCWPLPLQEIDNNPNIDVQP